MIDFKVPDSILAKQYLGESLKERVEEEKEIAFDLEKFQTSHPFFITEDRDIFSPAIKNSKILKFYQNLGNQNISYYNDLITNFNKKEKYKNKSILILGGGPTTNIILDKLDEIPHDYVWSVNKCYLNKKIPDIDTYFASRYMVDQPYFTKNKQYMNFLSKINNIVFCENLFAHNIFNRSQHTKIPNLTTMFQTQDIVKKENIYWEFYRLDSILGCGIRMIISAIYSGAKNIYIAGIDGYDINGTNNHSFEKNKLPHNFTTAPTDDIVELYGHMEIHYFWFYKYLLELQKEFNFNIINLAEDYPEISQFGRITKEYK
tara:strand:- start:3724 stop:4674 length:951 start_codon:yes stop_codon:yes gene_type:complete